MKLFGLDALFFHCNPLKYQQKYSNTHLPQQKQQETTGDSAANLDTESVSISYTSKPPITYTVKLE